MSSMYVSCHTRCFRKGLRLYHCNSSSLQVNLKHVTLFHQRAFYSRNNCSEFSDLRIKFKRNLLRRRLFTSTTENSNQISSRTVNEKAKRKLNATIALLTVSTIWIVLSTYNRKWREMEISNLPSAISSQSIEELTTKRDRTLDDILHTIQRCGLMGHSSSVKEELDRIRGWHQEHGYRGGLVVRELNQPLYGTMDQYLVGEQGGELPMDELNTRECYYLYYEMLGNGQVMQQIFCRGTTLRADVGKCLKSIYLFDPELGCNIHLGFREHAERLLRDLEPLLLRSTENRGTIEVSGHSLGGAVAMIVALKLIKRGYNVTRVTTVAAPKLCDASAVEKLTPLLPRDVLRIENDDDIVTYMPPTGSHLGDKLWFTSNKENPASFIPASEISSHTWIDSTFLNCFLLESLTRMPRVHRTTHYADNFETYILNK